MGMFRALMSLFGFVLSHTAVDRSWADSQVIGLMRTHAPPSCHVGGVLQQGGWYQIYDNTVLQMLHQLKSLFAH
jgi:hypothetical protein